MTTALLSPGLTVSEIKLGWQEQGLCAQVDNDAFFVEKGGSTRDAVRICIGCDVREKCLQYALDQDERFGVWGGLTERQRRKLKRALPAATIPRQRQNIDPPKVRRVSRSERQLQILAFLDSCGGEITSNASAIGRMLKLVVPSAAATMMHDMVEDGIIEWQPRGRHDVQIRILAQGVARLRSAA